MKKIILTYAPYKLKLKTPFITSKAAITERKGFIIKLTSSSGMHGIGDAAPLPEFGSESYEKVQRILDNLEIPYNINFSDFKKGMEETLSKLHTTPVLKHGVEQALLNLICSEQNTDLNSILKLPSKNKIKVNSVIGFMPPEEASKKAAELLKAGYTSIKLKVGNTNLTDDLNVISAVRNIIEDDIKLRVDANGVWSLEKAIKALKKFEEFNLEYAEQPVNSYNDFLKLSNACGIALAADESIRNYDEAVKFITSKAVKVLVLKPMMLGGILPTLKIINMAEQNNIKVIISSSFESVIGRSTAIFAASLLKTDDAHGLDTAKYFENDLFTNPYPVQNGTITLTV